MSGVRGAAVPRATWRRPPRRRVRAIRDRLRWLYGIPISGGHGAPLDELILTVLSQSTNDRNRDVAYLRLRARLPSWGAVRDAPLAEVEAAIRPGGISKVKSARIQAILRALPEDLDLSWMAQAPVEEARAALCALPGVGRKTANVVLNIAFGEPTIAVDTHLFRVANRLAIAPGKTLLEVETKLLAVIPPKYLLHAHHWLILHGRYVCIARKPECPRCVIADLCLYTPKTRAIAPTKTSAPSGAKSKKR